MEEESTVEDTGQAQEKAKEVAGQAKGRLREQVDQRSTEAGHQVSSAADDVRSVAEQLRSQGKDTPARYAEQAAEKAQKVGQRLQDASGDELLRDVEDFARKNPWAVAAGGLALGLAASRMLKASSSERYRSSMQNGSGSNGQARSLAAEPMPSGASTSGGKFAAEEHVVGARESIISTEPRA
jgi:broad specificity phosphatase PhoE